MLDFGLAKVPCSGASFVRSDSFPTVDLNAEHLTSPGTALGIVSYMSPEQVRGKELDVRQRSGFPHGPFLVRRCALRDGDRSAAFSRRDFGSHVEPYDLGVIAASNDRPGGWQLMYEMLGTGEWQIANN
jgi:hypothetical protein